MDACLDKRFFRRNLGLIVWLALLLAGCGPAHVTLDVHQNVNPDIHGRPSPIVLRIYELRAADGFNGADFISLYERDKEILGADLLAREEMTLIPGEKKEFKRELQKGTRFVGVMAAFRDLNHSQWRSILEVKPGKTSTLEIMLDGQKMTVSAR